MLITLSLLTAKPILELNQQKSSIPLTKTVFEQSKFKQGEKVKGSRFQWRMVVETTYCFALKLFMASAKPGSSSNSVPEIPLDLALASKTPRALEIVCQPSGVPICVFCNKWPETLQHILFLIVNYYHASIFALSWIIAYRLLSHSGFLGRLVEILLQIWVCIHCFTTFYDFLWF